MKRIFILFAHRTDRSSLFASLPIEIISLILTASKFHRDLLIPFKYDRQATFSENIKGATGICLNEHTNQLLITGMNHRVTVYKEQDLSYLFQFGNKEQILNFPTGITYHPQTKQIYVCDTYNKQIQILDIAGNPISQFSVNRSKHMRSDPSTPNYLCIDKEDHIYFTDAHGETVHVTKLDGEHLFSFGRHLQRTYGGTFDVPSGIAIAKNTDKLFICDLYNERVKVMTTSGDLLYLMDIGKFRRPACVHVDADNNVFVTDQILNKVMVFDQNGNYLLDFGAGVFGRPADLVTSDENLYVCDSKHSRVYVWK